MAKSNGNEMIKLGGILFVITAVVALLLGGVNSLTAPAIAANDQAKLEEALAVLVPDTEASDNLLTEAKQYDGAPNGATTVTAVYEMKSGDETEGYCVQVEPNGFGGAISMLVGVSSEDQTITGIQILSMSETPGLGANASDPEWQAQFAGKAADGSLEVIKNETAEGKITAITGSTITSKAVTTGVNAAVAAVNEYAG
ncbi:MAG: RnfABCDGE type electron transport complex subunit G [Butyricicoccaceae bacterium]